KPSQVTEITLGAGKLDGVRGLAWLPEGDLLYMGSEVNPQIWRTDRDGSHRRQLTHLDGGSQEVSATADAAVFFAHAGSIWIVSIDGCNLTRMTDSNTATYYGEISPDEKF